MAEGARLEDQAAAARRAGIGQAIQAGTALVGGGGGGGGLFNGFNGWAANTAGNNLGGVWGAQGPQYGSYGWGQPNAVSNSYYRAPGSVG